MTRFLQFTMAAMHVRNDDVFFSEYVTNSCAAVQHDEDDEAHSGMTKTARDFLKKKFGTISRFYSGITSADTADINGFSRINSLRKALAALDRGGWERSYHQRIFHVSERRDDKFFLWQLDENLSTIVCIFAIISRVLRCSDSQYTYYHILGTGILFEFSCTSALQNRPPWIF